MKESEIVSKLIAEGKAVTVGEWRGSSAETINYVTTKGAKASFGRVVHLVELGDGTSIVGAKVSQSVPDGTDPKSVVVPYKRGQRVIIEVESLEIDKGNRTIRTSGMSVATG